MQSTESNYQRRFGSTVAVRSGSSSSRQIEYYHGVQKNLIYGRRELAFGIPLARFVISLLIFCFVALAAVPFYSSSSTMSELQIVVAVSDGAAEVIRSRNGAVEQLSAGAQVNLSVHDLIRTTTGTARMVFSERQQVELMPDSQITVEHFDIVDERIRLEYFVWNGYVHHQTVQTNHNKDWIQISTPSSSAWVRNAELSVHVLNSGQTYFRIDEGVARITKGAQEIFLAPDEQMIVNQNQPLVKPTLYKLDLTELLPQSVPNRDHPAQLAQPLPGASHTSDLELTNEWSSYVVVPGDSLWTIAARHSLTTEDLIQANPEIKNFALIQAGQSLRIPLAVPDDEVGRKE